MDHLFCGGGWRAFQSQVQPNILRIVCCPFIRFSPPPHFPFFRLFVRLFSLSFSFSFSLSLSPFLSLFLFLFVKVQTPHKFFRLLTLFFIFLQETVRCQHILVLLCCLLLFTGGRQIKKGKKGKEKRKIQRKWAKFGHKH